MSKRKLIEKELSVALQVQKIGSDGKIMFNLNYPKHLQVCQNIADDMVNKLFHQVNGGDIKIIDLKLVWKEEADHD